MIKYKNSGGDSGVAYYEPGNDYIKVQFTSGKIYTYSYNSAGTNHVERMKSLAKLGRGLNSYIMLHVKFKYER